MSITVHVRTHKHAWITGRNFLFYDLLYAFFSLVICFSRICSCHICFSRICFNHICFNHSCFNHIYLFPFSFNPIIPISAIIRKKRKFLPLFFLFTFFNVFLSANLSEITPTSKMNFRYTACFSPSEYYFNIYSWDLRLITL